MKKRILLLSIFAALLCACQPSAKATPTALATVTNTSAPTLAASNTPAPSPSTPTANATPIALELAPIIEKIPSHPLALNESNVRVEMKRLNIYGTGALQATAFSPNGKYFAAATGRGVYIYDGLTFEPIGLIDVNDLVAAIAFSPDGLAVVAATGGRASLWNVLSGQKMLDLDGEMDAIATVIYSKGGHIAAWGNDCIPCDHPNIQALILWDAKTGRQLYVEHNIIFWSEGIAFSNDGKKLAFVGKQELTILDIESGKQTHVKDYVPKFSGTTEFVNYLLFDKDDLNLYVSKDKIVAYDNRVTYESFIFNLSNLQIKPFSTCDTSYMTSIDTMGVCSRGMGQEIVFFNLSDGGEISSIYPPDFNVGGNLNSNIFSINPNGDLLAYSTSSYKTYGDRNILHIFNTQTNTEVKTLRFDGFHDIQTGMSVLDGEKRYIGGLQDEPAQFNLVDLETGASLRTFKLENTTLESFGFRPDYKTVGIIDRGNNNNHYATRLSLWDLQSQNMLYQTIWPEDLVQQIGFSPDGLDVLLTTWPGLEFFAFNLPTKESTDLGSDSFPYSYDQIEFANDRYHFNQYGNLVVLGYQGNFPTFTDSKTKQGVVIPYEVATDADHLEAFAISPDGKFVAFGNTTDIFVWDMETLKQVATLSGHELWEEYGAQAKIRSLMFSPQSDLLVSVGWDKTTRLWNIHSGQELRRLNVCCSAEFTPDGRYLVTAGDGVMRVWGIPTP